MSSLVFILTTILKQQICSVQVKIQDWNSKDKEGGVEGQIRQRKTEKRKTIPPFVADDLIPVPGCSGVWEKHFPLVLLHSCSQWKSHIRDNIQNSSWFLVSCELIPTFDTFFFYITCILINLFLYLSCLHLTYLSLSLNL